METGAAGTSSVISQPQEEQRPQAAPLPRKRGEIGYQEGASEQEQGRSSTPDVVLPPRHPADRDSEQGSTAGTTPAVTDAGTGPSSSTSDVTSTINSVAATKRKAHLLGFFKCKNENKLPQRIGGIASITLFKFALHLLLLGGTIVVWVFTTKLILRMRTPDKQIPLPTIIFVHLIFSVASLAQLFLLERRIFRMRAERYNHLHPGEVLPSFRLPQTLPNDTIALAPWNRPPLPTYAAVLAQSGIRGTGDVEDHVIAQQPPPAYGNTRGSTFLLSGFLNEELRVQRPASVHSVSSRHDRPKSYHSQDEEWEVIRDADRALRLEETLTRLERSGSRSSRA